jgi:Asp-tRNA(Asn)/Glu-tRNA(Gln) amidotransferase A subunit family amidase
MWTSGEVIRCRLMSDVLTRKEFVTSLLIAAVSTGAAASSLKLAQGQKLTLDDLKSVERLAGIEFSDAERQRILQDVQSAERGYEAVRAEPISYTTEPSTVFTPLGGGSIPGSRVQAKASQARKMRKGLSNEDIAFLPLPELANLVRTRQISSVELTEIYLDRLKAYGDKLLCVVTLTSDLAMSRAKAADREIASGHYRGPLHGIPYGIKDLFATKGIATTWGADPYSDQVPDFDATVVEKLDRAGAVLVAKLSMGALAQGDVWFRGTTKNPWNPKQGSSGSSAGPASATAAGLVGFSIGTETLGSIVSPSIRCRVTGLRPTYGRISRYGGMALSYTMDKAGPICRRAEDTALVLAAICGSDPRDASAVDRTFDYPQKLNYAKLKVGFLVRKDNADDLKSMADDVGVKTMRELGMNVVPVWFSPLNNALIQILDVESASAFDEFTRGEKIHELKNSSWPETFRAARYVPAVEYLQAQRARTLLMRRFEQEFGELDLFMAMGGGYTLAHTNLTGHPQIVIPWGGDQGNSRARSLVGRLYREDVLISVAKAIQDKLPFAQERPDLSLLG